eukprot:1949237-Amphidinium_carterae.1
MFYFVSLAPKPLCVWHVWKKDSEQPSVTIAGPSIALLYVANGVSYTEYRLSALLEWRLASQLLRASLYMSLNDVWVESKPGTTKRRSTRH